MKHLIKRDDFLRKTKVNESKTDFLMEIAISKTPELIRESSNAGPFVNEVSWNDSLLGRLVNHIFRKAKIALNMVRIQPVIMRLKSEFNNLVAEGYLAGADGDQKIDIFRIKISEMLWELKNTANSEGRLTEKGRKVLGVNISYMKELIVSINELIKENESNPDISGINNFDNLKKEMEDFETFIEPLEEELREEEVGEEGEEQDSEGEEGEEQDSEGEEGAVLPEDKDGVLTQKEAERIEPSYPIMMENLRALLGVLTAASAEPKSGQQTGVGQSKVVYKYKVRKGETLASIQANKAVNKNNLTIDAIKKKNPITSTIKDTDSLIKKNITELILESGQQATPDKATQAKANLENSIKMLISSEKGIGVTPDLIKSLITNAKKTDGQEDNSKLIISLYNEINIFLKGDKKATLQDPTPLFKEGYNYLMPKTSSNPDGGKIFAIAEKIARFTKRALQFDGKNLYAALGDLGTNLQKFVDTIKKCMVADIIKETPKETKKEERLIMGYSRFLMIKEADKADDDDEYGDFDPDEEDETPAPTNKNTPPTNQDVANNEDDGEPSDPDTGSIWERIKIYWDSKCKTTKTFILDRTESDKIRVNIEKIKEGGNFCINGMDPVIQIARLFNRAYKIYTTNTITRRNDGKVDARTWEEYDSFGGNSSGNINGWAGPFRNKKIFNQWENAVMKIIGDRKYEFIFSSSTALRMPKVSNPTKASDFEMRPGAGAKLRSFILDMLDGDELYKSGTDKGAQNKFLEKYFGSLDGTKTESLTFTENEGKENQELVQKISDAAIKLKFSKGMNIKEIKKGMAFSIVGQIKEGDRTIRVHRFFFVHDAFSNGYSYLSLANTFAYHKALLEQLPNEEDVDKRVKEISRGDMTQEDYVTKQKFMKGNEERTYTPKYTKSKNILDILKIGASVKLKTADNDKNIQEEIIKIENVYWISQDGEKGQETYSNPMVSPQVLSKLRLGNLKKTDVKNFVDASNVGDGMSISR